MKKQFYMGWIFLLVLSFLLKVLPSIDQIAFFEETVFIRSTFRCLYDWFS